MRGEDQVRTRLRARPIAEHVAFLVDAHVLQAELAEHLCVDFGALRFLERRRLNLAKPDLILDRLRLARLDRFDRSFDRGIRHELWANVRGILLRQRCDRRRKQNKSDQGVQVAIHRDKYIHPGTLGTLWHLGNPKK